MDHKPTLPFAHTSGPRDAKIALVGEAWGEQEDLAGRPFEGSAGQELTKMLHEAGIDRRKCFLTNVLALRPPDNNLDLISCNKLEAGSHYPMPPLKLGKYLEPKFLPEIERLKTELTSVSPHLIVALGNTACWALLNTTRIGSIRGAITTATLVPGLKVLPTYHPSAVLRNWAFRPIVLADFMKALRQMAFPEVRRPERQVLINPTLDEIRAWIARPALRYSVDIETWAKQITMIGFARSKSDSIVIPFINEDGSNYWPDIKSEVLAWELVGKLLSSPIPKIFQNGLYDLQYLVKMGFRPKNCTQDTMLLHHAMYPELQKGLGFLGSIYSDEAAWKLMRHQEAFKKDE